MKIKQLPCKAQCPWHGCHPDGKEYTDKDIFPQGVCPFLYHSLYPYFLGLLYGADMNDIWVCCPAEKGVDCYVRKDTAKGQDGWWTIYAEVVNVDECPHGHIVGSKLIFPTAHKSEFICPAGLNNILPFLDLEVPKCINPKRLRCPDWKDNITYEYKTRGNFINNDSDS
jgi:hypothetical protein